MGSTKQQTAKRTKKIATFADFEKIIGQYLCFSESVLSNSFCTFFFDSFKAIKVGTKGSKTINTNKRQINNSIDILRKAQEKTKIHILSKVNNDYEARVKREFLKKTHI